MSNKKTKSKKAVVPIPISTTWDGKQMALLISEKIGSCKRNSLETGTGKSVSHGYNASLLIAAKVMGLADITKIDPWYNQYKSIN